MTTLVRTWRLGWPTPKTWPRLARCWVEKPSSPLRRRPLCVTSTAATTVVDGPFVELKEHVGGYYVIDVDTLDDAIEWARKLPVGTGAVEVRPIMPTGPEN